MIKVNNPAKVNSPQRVSIKARIGIPPNITSHHPNSADSGSGRHLDEFVPLKADEASHHGGRGHHGRDDLPCNLLRLGSVGLRDPVVARPENATHSIAQLLDIPPDPAKATPQTLTPLESCIVLQKEF